MPKQIFTKTTEVSGRMEFTPWEIAVFLFAGTMGLFLLFVLLKRFFFSSRPASAGRSPSSSRATPTGSSCAAPRPEKMLPATTPAILRYLLRQLFSLVGYPFRLIICLIILAWASLNNFFSDPVVDDPASGAIPGEKLPDNRRWEEVPSVVPPEQQAQSEKKAV